MCLGAKGRHSHGRGPRRGRGIGFGEEEENARVYRAIRICFFYRQFLTNLTVEATAITPNTSDDQGRQGEVGVVVGIERALRLGVDRE